MTSSPAAAYGKVSSLGLGSFCLSLALALPSTSRAATSTAPARDRSFAERTLMQGNIDDAVNQLHALIAANPADGKAHLLLCRAFYAEELPDQAVAECETALKTNNTSETQDWMGRAYGIEADASGPIAAYKLARKVQAAFEAAVQLDANNDAAVDDLSEYYVAAPSVLGGSYDKALALANRVQANLPQPAHRIRALVAEHRHDFATAEQEFRAAVGVSGRADAWADLGNFYGRRKQYDKAVDALQHGLVADHVHGESTVDAASILYDIHRENRLAEQSLCFYLVGNARTDAAPVIKAHVILGQLLAEDGDKTGAKIEFNKALELAANYGRAKNALQGL